MNFTQEMTPKLGTNNFYGSDEIITSIELTLLGLNSMHNAGNYF